MPKRYPLASLLIHCLLILGLVIHGGGESGSGGGSADGQHAGSRGEQVKIIPKVVEVDIVDTKPQEKSEIKGPKAIPLPPHDCWGKNWYGGVGLEENYWNGGKISNVFPGYPAAGAGVMPGDMIVLVNGIPESGVNAIRGDPGTTVTLTVMRNGIMLNFTMTRDRICTEK